MFFFFKLLVFTALKSCLSYLNRMMHSSNKQKRCHLFLWTGKVQNKRYMKSSENSQSLEWKGYSKCVQIILPFGDWSRIQSMRRYEVCLTNKVHISLEKKVLLTLRTLLFVMCAFSYSLWFSTFPALLFRRI